MQLQTQSNRGFAPATITEAIQFSEMLAKSQMVPRQYQNKPEDIMVAVQWGYEIGLAPLQALQNISVINGKPSVYGDAAMALVQASQVCDGIEEHIENEGTPNPVAVCIAKRKGRNPVIARFSVEDAKRAGLWGKQGPWQAYPKRMLQMRARGFALRDAFPDVLKGLITAEEAADYPQEAAKDITPPKATRNPLDALPSPVTPQVTTVTEPPYVPGTWSEETERGLEEANSVAAEVSAEASEVIEVELPGNQDTNSSGWALAIPGKDAVEYPDAKAYIDAYKAMIDKVVTAGKASAATRLAKIKELRSANEATINRIPSLERIQITAHLAKYQGSLEAKASQESA